MSFIVAIDGPAGSGKGTVTKIVAKKENLIAFDTGAMYRAISYYMLKNSISLDDKDKINELLKNINMELSFEDDNQVLYLNSKRLITELRTKEVNEIVSQVSHIPEVRQAMVEIQRKISEGKNVILEGRDIGTNVFPNADVKIYLDASPEERAKRRLKQNLENNISNISYEEILENIKFRDYNDKTSDVAPLIQAEDAILIDSTNLSIEEVVEKICEIIDNVKKQDKKIIQNGDEEIKEKKEKKIIKNANEKKKDNNLKKKHRIGKKLLRVIVKSTIYSYCKVLYRMKIVGTENIPKSGAVIFCGNHKSFLDPQLIEVTCKRDDTRFLAKKELTKNKGLKFLGKVFDAILVSHDEKDVVVVKESLRTLKNGNCIALFPEGTRKGLEKGEKVKDGTAYFALNSDAIVIPVGIKGGNRFFQKAFVKYGKPIDLSKYKTIRKEEGTLEKVTDIIMENIIELTK